MSSCADKGAEPRGPLVSSPPPGLHSGDRVTEDFEYVVECASGVNHPKSKSQDIVPTPGDSGRMALTNPKFCSPSAWSALYGSIMKRDLRYMPRTSDLVISKQTTGQYRGQYYICINLTHIVNWTCNIYDAMPHATITYHAQWNWHTKNEYTIDAWMLLNACSNEGLQLWLEPYNTQQTFRIATDCQAYALLNRLQRMLPNADQVQREPWELHISWNKFAGK